MLTASEVAFNVIKWCGVGYLGWLGARTVPAAAVRGKTARAAADGDRADGA